MSIFSVTSGGTAFHRRRWAFLMHLLGHGTALLVYKGRSLVDSPVFLATGDVRRLLDGCDIDASPRPPFMTPGFHKVTVTLPPEMRRALTACRERGDE